MEKKMLMRVLYKFAAIASIGCFWIQSFYAADTTKIGIEKSDTRKVDQSGKEKVRKKAGIIPYVIDPKTNDVKMLIGFGPAKYYWGSKTESLPCSLWSQVYVQDKWTDFGGSVEEKDLKKYSESEALKVAAAREAHEELMGYFSAATDDLTKIADNARKDDAIKNGIAFWTTRINDENKVTTKSGYIYWFVPIDYPSKGESAQLSDLRRLYISMWDRSPLGSQRTIPCGSGNYQWPMPDSFTEKRDFRWVSAQDLITQIDKLDAKNPKIKDPVNRSESLELYPKFVESLKEGKDVLLKIVNKAKHDVGFRKQIIIESKDSSEVVPTKGDEVAITFTSWLGDKNDNKIRKITSGTMPWVIGRPSYKGFNEALSSMKLGEKSRIILAPGALGEKEEKRLKLSDQAIVIYEIDMLDIKPGREGQQKTSGQQTSKPIRDYIREELFPNAGFKKQILIETKDLTALLPVKNDEVVITFTSWLGDKNDNKIRKIASGKTSWVIGKPSYKGFNEALSSMKLGEKSRIVLAPGALGEKEEKRFKLPDQAIVIYEIELTNIVKKPESYDRSVTPLMKAVAKDQLEEITLLLQRGGYLFEVDKNEKDAFDYITYYDHPINKGTFKIISISTPDRKSFATITGRNQDSYARKHNYTYRVYNHSFDKNRPEEWSKIAALIQQIGKTSYEWLLWIDDDIMITNPSIKLESFVDKYPQYDLIIAKDALVPLNNGIFLIKNNRWAKKFLMDVWITGAYRNLLTRGISLLEQQTMTNLYNENREYRDKIIVLPQRQLNSFLRSAKDYPHDPYESKWQPGDFVAHITGSSYENRTKIAQELEQNPNKIPIFE